MHTGINICNHHRYNRILNHTISHSAVEAAVIRRTYLSCQRKIKPLITKNRFKIGQNTNSFVFKSYKIQCRPVWSAKLATKHDYISPIHISEAPTIDIKRYRFLPKLTSATLMISMYMKMMITLYQHAFTFQYEEPDDWLCFGNPWERVRQEFAFPVHFYGRMEYADERGLWKDYTTVYAVPYDTPIPGYMCNVCCTLRLWGCKAPKSFDLEIFNTGGYIDASYSTISISIVCFTEYKFINDQGLLTGHPIIAFAIFTHN